jgi:GNAT superfamily N-acetyltransferase
MAPGRAIRPPRADDAAVMADLAEQLGYPVSAVELGERLDDLRDGEDAAVMVATDLDDRPLGWVHVEIKRTLLAPLSAQIMGLVVDASARNVGVGRDLLSAAEAWAAARGCRQMLVGSRVTRERAHRFYLREGYAIQKTSFFFEKQLP